MKNRLFVKLSAFTLLTAFCTLFAEEAPAPTAADSKKSADDMLAFIPEEVVHLDGKVVVKRADVVQLLKPQLEQYFQNENAPEISQEQIQSVVYNFSKNLMTYEILLQNAIKEGGKIDLAAAR
ncbi:MAG: hypothetical protein WCT05_02325, partial [Lentisphaeria bacterium]